jgi:hypothetical protein
LAVNVRVVVPTGRLAGALLVTGTGPSTRSLAFAAARKAATSFALLARLLAPFEDTVIGAGTFNVGFVVSTTVAVKEAVPRLPKGSDAVQVTPVRPSGKTEPGLGLQLTGTGSPRSKGVETA